VRVAGEQVIEVGGEFGVSGPELLGAFGQLGEAGLADGRVQDVQPSGYEEVLMPVHAVSLVAMGLWPLDNCDLEAYATTAAELGQWDFHLAVAPVASPVRPAARSTRSPHSDRAQSNWYAA
jgi:hypothetical protein